MLIILANSHFVPIKDPAIRSETIGRAEGSWTRALVVCL
jgi:hypothetical protein